MTKARDMEREREREEKRKRRTALTNINRSSQFIYPRRRDKRYMQGKKIDLKI